MTISAVARPSYALAQERLALSERLALRAQHGGADERMRAWALHRRAYLSHLDRYLAWTRHATIEERTAELRAWNARRLDTRP